tara:strand:+ start:2953 stop:4425 length:1473 start_codon:yes stop_codon:yes gene_type:complete
MGITRPIILAIMFLSGCARLDTGLRAPSSATTDFYSCKTLMTQIRRLSNLNGDKTMSVELRSQLWDGISEFAVENKVDNYIDLVKLNFDQDEMSFVLKGLSEGEFGQDRMNYLIWSGGQVPKRRKNALSELSSWSSPENTKELKKFLKARKKFDQWEDKKFKDLLKDAGDSGDVELIKRQARMQRHTYERLKYACSAKLPNTDNAAAGKNFRRFILTVGPMSVLAGYTVANWSELQDAWAQMQEGEGAPLKSWFKHLGYDLSIGIILNYTIGRIFSEPTGTYAQKVIKGYGADLVIGTADMFAYNIIFPGDDEKLKERFEELKTTPDFEEKMKLLQSQLDHVGFVVKFKRSVMQNFKEIIGQAGPMSIPEAGLAGLSVQDLENPEVQKLVMQALTSQLYEEGRYGAEPPEWSESLINTGEGGSDRLFFYASVGPIYHTVNIAIATRIYQTICMGKNNLSQAFAKAALMHTAWAFSYNLFEFPLRSQMINQ